MAKWRVWNKHPEGMTHREKFREELVEIPANKYVLMDYEDAVQFRGQFFPMKRKPTGEPDPAGFKAIFLEKHDGPADEIQVREFICHIDGRKFPSQALLDAYLKENYSDSPLLDKSAEEALAEATTVRRGPGRPPKAKEQSA